MNIIKTFIHYTTVIIFSLLSIYLLSYYFWKKDFFLEELNSKTNIIIDGPVAPRGRILDKNGIVLVDNIAINNVVFHYVKSTDLKAVAVSLTHIFADANPSDEEFITWYKAYYDEEKLLTNEEQTLYKQRKIDKQDKEKIINDKILSLKEGFTEEELNLAKMYGVIASGYQYDDKIIQKDVSDDVVSKVLSTNLPGVSIETSFKRYYPYGNTLREIFGSVGKITKENKHDYLGNGYKLNDEVGISYLEKEYDEYLKGTKAKYLVNSDNSLTLISEEKRGNDIYLSIDINLQLEAEKIIEENLQKAKGHPNTEFLNDSYLIISNPKTSEINAIVGKRYLKDNTFNDIVLGTITSSYTMGSVVKGATISVGYKYDLIDPSKLVHDGCVKLYSQTQKCSWMDLGYLNSVTALKQSSNYYQFLIAIGLTGQTYTPNMKLNVNEKHFTYYRQMLASYGLGGKTGIDLPGEVTGIQNSNISPDLLLNLAIGQYDTYTPMQLMAYINTIAADGQRRRPSLVTKISSDDEIIYENSFAIVEKVDITEEQIKLIQEGFHEVMQSGTGAGFMNHAYNAAGKTGTSEGFVDSNNDGIFDASTLTLTMASYFPYDNPQYSFIIVCPNVVSKKNNSNYIYYLTSYISHNISDFLFENMLRN